MEIYLPLLGIYFFGFLFSIIIFSAMSESNVIFHSLTEAIIGSIFWFIIVPIMLVVGVIKVPNILYNIIKRI